MTFFALLTGFVWYLLWTWCGDRLGAAPRLAAARSWLALLGMLFAAGAAAALG